jgi:glycosyltransferase involved in cell wall biosynthesis
MRLLLGASPSKIFHMKEFVNELEKINIECNLVLDIDISDRFPSRKISHWFQSSKKFEKLIKEFKPDAIFVDRQRHFVLDAIKTNIPLLIHLRGDIWKEIEMAKKTLYKLPHKRIVLKKWENIANESFKKSNLILPICNYLENETKERLPEKKVATMYQGINYENWYKEKEMELKHPCVGFLQGSVILEKAKEMLTLTKVIESMPEVTFYWAGDGPYRDIILTKLKKYNNFHWLGPLEYPGKVREFLSSIDIYGLASGIDMSPLTLLEAQLMEKPVIASKVGGIPELMIDNETGFLVNKGNSEEWKEKISILLNDTKKQRKMGQNGKKFVKENFAWQIIAKKFKKTINEQLKL